MKHCFQYLLTGAVLLVALMISNGQNHDSSSHRKGHPVTDRMELLAKLPPGYSSELTVSSYNQSPVFLEESVQGRHKNHESLYSSYYQTLLKTQILIHLDLKPDLYFQSGYTFHHPSKLADPPSA